MIPVRRGELSIRTVVGLGLLWVLLAIVLASIDQRGGWIEVSLETKSPGLTQAQLYFDRGEGFNDSDRVSTWVNTGHNTLRFALPPGTYTSFRLDPNRGDTALFVHRISLSPGRQEAVQGISPSRLSAGNQVGDIRSVGDAVLVQPIAGASAVQLLVASGTPVVVSAAPLNMLLIACSATLLMLCFLALWRFAFRQRCSWKMGVCLGLVCTFVLGWTMAWTSSHSLQLHPDEIAHLWALQYHFDHLLPPAIDNPDIIRTISVYGFSYLFELDVAYALAARAVAPFAGLFTDDLIAARMFNLGLLLLLACLAARNGRWALCMAVLLISPQVWYVFSYFNADALPLFLGMAAACVVADEESGLNRYLRGSAPLRAGVLLFILSAGLLLVSKRNFLPVIPIFGLWLAIRHLGLGWGKVLAFMSGLALLGASVHLQLVPAWSASGMVAALRVAGVLLVLVAMLVACAYWWRNAELRPVFIRLVAVFALVFALAAPRVAMDLVLNGSPAHKSQTLEQIAEKYAGTGFKPSQLDQDIAYAGRGLALRGTTLDEVAFAPYHWLRTSLISAYGVYGYLVVFPPPWLPLTLQLITLLIALVAAASLITLDRRKAAPMLIAVLGGCTLIFLNSLLHSWVFDLQRQGRYLFPVLVLLALLLGSASPRLPHRLVGWLVFAGFALSCFSFATVALPALGSG